MSGEDAFKKDLSKSPTLNRGKQGSKMDMMMMMMMITEMDHLHKTAHAKIPDKLLLIHELLILCLLESRHSQVSKTVFILKFGSPLPR